MTPGNISLAMGGCYLPIKLKRDQCGDLRFVVESKHNPNEVLLANVRLEHKSMLHGSLLH